MASNKTQKDQKINLNSGNIALCRIKYQEEKKGMADPKSYLQQDKNVGSGIVSKKRNFGPVLFFLLIPSCELVLFRCQNYYFQCSDQGSTLPSASNCDSIGCTENISQEFSSEELKSLDSEGRCVITLHQIKSVQIVIKLSLQQGTVNAN